MQSVWDNIKLFLLFIDRRYSTPGLLTGTVFFAFSLTPSLLPRTSFVQGLISGCSLSAGYGLGVGGNWLWNYLGLPEIKGKLRRNLKVIFTVFCTVLAFFFLWWANGWQNSIRELMGMEKTAGFHQLVIGLVSLGLFLLVLGLAFIFRRTFQLLSTKLQKFISRPVSNLLGLGAAIALFWIVINGVFFAFLLRVADSTYRAFDSVMDPEVESPSTPIHPGSSASHLEWEGMGRSGRRFVSRTTKVSDIKEFTNKPVKTPIRVYAGLNNGETPEERAELVLRELQRVNAFHRSILVLVTPTGTGWVDESAIAPLEYLHRGDVATAAAQYSYLPSPLALWTRESYGVETAREVFRSVYGYWKERPEGERPKLYLFGLSLGALNSDRSFDFYDIIDEPFSGVLWAGPPFRSETWQSITERRKPESLAWKPRFRDGSVVRFANQNGGLDEGKAPWGSFRIAYLQYASDPVTFFNPDIFYRTSSWMEGTTGPDVSSELRWFPVVTGFQIGADIAFGHAPPGYGHNYRAVDYFESWYHLTEPEGWTNEERDRLKQKFKTFEEE